MSRNLTEDERLELANRALDAHIFRKMGISPNSRWAKNYSKVMREPLKPGEWRAFQEKLSDPAFADQWMDRVLSGWPHRKTSPSLRRPSNKSKGR